MTHMEVKELPRLWQHQIDCVNKARGFDYFALLMQPGCGKTATQIQILREVYSENKAVIPTLIICPPVVISNWKREVSVWSKIPENKIVMLKGSGKERLKLLLESDPRSIFITNYEALLMPELFEQFKVLLGSENSCMILDESHKVKDVASKRTKRAIELADVTTYRYLLTGTPILNDLMDIFSQFRILDRGERFGKNFFTFRAKFFEDKNKAMPAARYFPNWQPIRGADKLIKELMDPVSMYVEKSTCLDLPPMVRKTIEIEMGKEQKKLYEDMRRDLVASITGSDGKERHSIAELAITKALRLQQIVSGHLKTEHEDGDKVITIKDNPRKQALKQLLEDLAPSHKTVVWAVFHANYDDIREVCNELKLEYAELNGLVKDKDAQAEKFRTNDKCRVLIGHPGSGGIGINLVEASYSIYYSRSFSLEFDIQSEARNYRGGSNMHKSVTRIDLVTPNTIDELVLKALASKTKISDSILKQRIEEL